MQWQVHSSVRAIHAATMVAAGIFLLVRIDFLFTDQVLPLHF